MIHTLGFSPSLDISYTVDAIEAGAIHRPRTVLRVAGGKSLNASRALAGLGWKVRAIVPLGGLLGDLVEELLIPTGVILDRIVTDQPTRLCVSASDESAHTLTEFYEPGPAGDELILAEVAGRLAEVTAGRMADHLRQRAGRNRSWNARRSAGRNHRPRGSPRR